MRSLWFSLVVGSTLTIGGCGGGRSMLGPAPPVGTTVTLGFSNGTPQAAAVQIGSGAFTAAPVQNGQVSLILPPGMTKYAVAYVCPPVTSIASPSSNEFVIEATIQDGTSFTLSCGAAPATGSATGSVDASSVPGANDVLVTGSRNFAALTGVTSSFNVNMPAGTNDVAAVVVDGMLKVLAVKMVRSQTVPGAINGGGAIVVGPADETSLQALTVNNVPAGFNPVTFVGYQTANGGLIELSRGGAANYRAFPVAAAQSGDFYFFDCGALDTATPSSTVAVFQTTTSGGGPMNFTLPAPWSFSGPTPAALPTFVFNYSGFTGISSTADQIQIGWAPTPATETRIQVTATGSFLNGVTTLTIPDLSTMPGFFAPPPSGATVGWDAHIYAGDVQAFVLSSKMPANGSVSMARNRGNYTVP